MCLPRRLFMPCIAASLVLFIALLLLWHRSHGRADYLAYCQSTREAGIISSTGHVLVYWESAIAPFRWGQPFGWVYASRPAPRSIDDYKPPRIHRDVTIASIRFIAGDNARYTANALIFPYWLLAAMAAALPSLTLTGTLISRCRKK